jgi:hypothetical protein
MPSTAIDFSARAAWLRRASFAEYAAPRRSRERVVDGATAEKLEQWAVEAEKLEIRSPRSRDLR